MTRTHLRLLPALLLLGSGCYASHGRAPDAAPPVVIDASSMRPDTPIPDPVDECAPMDARGEGDCFLSFGVAWDGSSCVGVHGCTCVGTDCGALYTTLDECVTAHRECSFASRTASALRGCSPKGGESWTLSFSGFSDCVHGPGLVIQVMGDMSPGARYEIEGHSDGSYAFHCAPLDGPCIELHGSVSVRAFSPGTPGSIDYELRAEDGRTFTGTGVEIAEYCVGLPVGC